MRNSAFRIKKKYASKSHDFEAYFFSSSVILSIRFWWRPPSNSVSRKRSTMSIASPGPTTRPPKQMAFALLCIRVYRALNVSEQQAARMPGILFAAMLMPMPVPQMRIAFEQRPSVTARQAASAKSG